MDTSLIHKLRRRIKDDRPNQRAMGLSVTDDASNRATCEIRDGHLMVMVVGSSTTPSIDLDLSTAGNATLGMLYQRLANLSGYTVQRDEDMQEGHPSLDLMPMGPIDIAKNRAAASLQHHLFSDLELQEVLDEAIKRHNPSLDIHSLPDDEEVFVMLLAHSEVCRRQAYDSSKRKGLTDTVDSLLAISRALEEQYERDTKRLARAIQSPKDASPNNVGSGDIMQGKMYRRSLRTGWMSPTSQNPGPTEPVMLDPDDMRDVEDTYIRVRWERNKDEQFYSAEVWMDSIPDVQRTTKDASLFAGRSPQDTRNTSGLGRQTTSKMVFRTFGANSNFEKTSMRVFASDFGQEVTNFLVEGFEPDTTYYARMFLVDTNREVASSNVVQYHTKPLRARFTQQNWANVLQATPGTTVTMRFDTAFGVVTGDHYFKLGEKEVDITIVDPYTATFVVPTFVNKTTKKDMVIYSPTELYDIRQAVFKVM